MQRQTGVAPKPILQARGLTKEFPGVTALDDVSIDIWEEEVLALVGENGAGKSTLVNVLSGVYQPDSGEILFAGEPETIRNPYHAASLGIYVVHQELSLLDELTISENIMLAHEPVRGAGIIDRRKLHEEASNAVGRVCPGINMNAIIRELTPSERQMVEIAKGISFNPRVLFLDEPTSSLSKLQVEQLFEVVSRLKASGIAIVFISHRMDELYQIADRATVLKDGRLVKTVEMPETPRDELIRLMVGRDVSQAFPEKPPYRHNSAAHGALLELRGAGLGDIVRDINLSVNPGEILGIGGLEGQGQRELVRSIFGITPFDQGEVLLDGIPRRITSPEVAIEHRIAFVSDDRKGEGLVLPLSVKHNMALASLDDRQRYGFVHQQEEMSVIGEYIETLSVKAAALDDGVGKLSGGNQQKIVFGKWMMTDPKILILHEPTRGIDVETKTEIYHLLRRLVNEGMGIILVTGDMLELIGLSDRIAVMFEGRIAGSVPASEATEEVLMTLGSGSKISQEGAFRRD